MTVSRLFVSLVAAFLVFPTDALSCSCADNQGSVEWALKTAGIAEYVFLGRVEELPPQETSDKALTPDDLTVEVSVVELLKGALGLPTIQIYSGREPVKWSRDRQCVLDLCVRFRLLRKSIRNLHVLVIHLRGWTIRYWARQFLGDPPTSEELNTMLRASHDPILSALRRAYR